MFAQTCAYTAYTNMFSNSFQPMAQWLQFIAKDAKKFPESAFKLLCYLAAHVYCVYVLLNGSCNFFDNPTSHWKGKHCEAGGTKQICLHIVSLYKITIMLDESMLNADVCITSQLFPSSPSPADHSQRKHNFLPCNIQ